MAAAVIRGLVAGLALLVAEDRITAIMLIANLFSLTAVRDAQPDDHRAPSSGPAGAGLAVTQVAARIRDASLERNSGSGMAPTSSAWISTSPSGSLTRK